ncbi:MAG TPA: FtsX-like permease family protein [Bacteroidales bacterium]|nr:FtsX-like permease family protein [Bacteroidales bacterium]HSA42662.1 FtsX-like permease family protein [Bacteroidales bacterium]
MISGISFLGVSVGTMALIVVLSVFNGFESLVINLFNSFNADYQVTTEKGKTFVINESALARLSRVEGVLSVSPVLEEKALIRYRSKQMIVNLKGVPADYGVRSGLDSMLVDGQFRLQPGSLATVVPGYGVGTQADLIINDFQNPVEIYLPRAGSGSMTVLSGAFNSARVVVSGVFSVQQEFDGKIVFVPFALMRDLLDGKEGMTSLEIRMKKGFQSQQSRKAIQELLPGGLLLKNRFEQEEMLFKVMRSEKWAIFSILTFILLIATFNVIGSLTMLILEKKKDIAVLFSLGATRKEIRNIFLAEGWIISLAGALSGLLLGGILGWLQQRYGLVSLGGADGGFLISAYPVKMKTLDFLYTFITVLAIGYLAAWIPVHRITQKYLDKRSLSS